MRVLVGHIMHEDIDGTEQQVQYLVEHLRGAGHHVDVMANRRGPMSTSRFRRTTAIFGLLFQSARAGPYDIVHAHHPMAAAVLVGAQGGRKVLTMHRRHLPWWEFVGGKPAGRLARRHERKAVREAEVLTAVDESTREYYRGLTDKPVHVIPAGIDMDSLPDDSHRRFERQVIYAGRLSAEKGIGELLTAAESLPAGTHLVIAGSGPEEPAVRAAAQQPNVHYLGRQPHDETVRWIRGSDVLIEPSLMTDGLPSVVLEAMACNTAVVAHRIPATEELMEDGVAALFEDHAQIPGIVDGLLADNARMDKMTARALKKAGLHDFGVIGRRYLDLYENLLDEPGTQ